MRNSVSRYAVLGSPVAHSKSPRIHAAFAAETNQQLDYTAVEVTGENFNAFAEDFFAKGGAGLNITVPHKEKAFKISIFHWICKNLRIMLLVSNSIQDFLFEDHHLLQ